MTRAKVIGVVLIGALALVLAPVPSAAEGEHAFVGSKNCKKCHLKQHKSWEETSMAKAFETLMPGVKSEEKAAAGFDPEKDYTTDAECVKCHVTGYGMTGGFVDIESTPELAGVGCETCHGPGGTYTQEHLMSLKNKEYKKAEVVAAGMVDTVTAEQCVGCHNADNPAAADDYEFDFEANKDADTHEHFPLKYSHD